jgi:hypothetical protein
MTVVSFIFFCAACGKYVLKRCSKLRNLYLYVHVSRKYYRLIDPAAPNTELYFINL